MQKGSKSERPISTTPLLDARKARDSLEKQNVQKAANDTMKRSNHVVNSMKERQRIKCAIM